MRRLLGILAVACAAIACAQQTPPFEEPVATGGEQAALPVDAPPALEHHPTDAVVEGHRDQLLAVPGVAGVGHGRTPDGSDAILVWVTDARAADQLPAEIDGYAVIVDVVPGGFRAF
jgi:hypothetical protein